MGKQVTKKIEKLELVKIEKHFNNPEKKMTFHYNLFLEGIDEPLILSVPDSELENGVVGLKIKFKLNEENLISDFDIV